MRISEHPVLDFDRGKKVRIYYNGQAVEAYENETIAAALHAAGIRRLGESGELHRPRGIYCAIGNCASCLMTVDEQPNTRICIVKCRDGMRVDEQRGRGVLKV